MIFDKIKERIHDEIKQYSSISLTSSLAKGISKGLAKAYSIIEEYEKEKVRDCDTCKYDAAELNVCDECFRGKSDRYKERNKKELRKGD